MADFLKAGGQNVLEEAAEKLHRVQSHLARPLRAHAAIGEGHPAIIADFRRGKIDEGSLQEMIYRGLSNLARRPPGGRGPVYFMSQG